MDSQNYDLVLTKLRAWVEDLGDKADTPVFQKAVPARPGTPPELVSPRVALAAVEKKEEFGLKLAEGWFDLAIRHILDSPTAKTTPGGQ